MFYLIRRIVFVSILLVIVVGGGYVGLRLYSVSQSNSLPAIQQWFNDVNSRSELATIRHGVACPDAPFILPSDGFIGLLWNDPAGPYTVLNTHTGIDIFGDGRPGEVPVYAAYDGYLTRLENWLSTVIIRHDDPLQPGREIWTYYTHMAAQDGSQSFIVPDFPPNTHGVWVTQGTLLGYQGEYAGESARPVGLHLHFSIVQSEPDGSFKNEARLGNTLDPSPYLGMPVAINGLPERPINCAAE
ncbi:MAG: M23 family metallopeptidase [Anaerolineaceae bacterium]|nr:M23 family metallopeptidase [Anaerolineaceae bacterium]